jgi:energy-coupling factor transport system ATP-binding protein
MIELKHIRFRYPGAENDAVLRGVSFRLGDGEKVAMMGANGSGKTTLVRLLNGLLLPEEGEVLVDGLSTRDPESLFPIRKRVGMVFQNPDNQIVAATVIREIAFGLENLGVPNKEMKNRVETALNRFHLEAYREHPPHLLSGGERQRLALASVWAMQPRYLILDEPTSLLDPVSRKETLHYLDTTHSQDKKGILLVTQFPEETLHFHRLVILHQGKVVQDGAPEQVFREVAKHPEWGVGIPVKQALYEWIRGITDEN